MRQYTAEETAKIADAVRAHMAMTDAYIAAKAEWEAFEAINRPIWEAAAEKRSDAERAVEESILKIINTVFPIFIAAATIPTPTEPTP
jgi:hypothetical protein